MCLLECFLNTPPPFPSNDIKKILYLEQNLANLIKFNDCFLETLPPLVESKTKQSPLLA